MRSRCELPWKFCPYCGTRAVRSKNPRPQESNQNMVDRCTHHEIYQPVFMSPYSEWYYLDPLTGYWQVFSRNKQDIYAKQRKKQSTSNTGEIPLRSAVRITLELTIPVCPGCSKDARMAIGTYEQRLSEYKKPLWHCETCRVWRSYRPLGSTTLASAYEPWFRFDISFQGFMIAPDLYSPLPSVRWR